MISNIVVKYQNYQYEIKFKEVQDLKVQAMVISNVTEKEYYNSCPDSGSSSLDRSNSLPLQESASSERIH